MFLTYFQNFRTCLKKSLKKKIPGFNRETVNSIDR